MATPQESGTDFFPNAKGTRIGPCSHFPFLDLGPDPKLPHIFTWPRSLQAGPSCHETG